MKHLVKYLVFISAIISLTSCAKMFGGMRKDLDDNRAANSAPTVGGAWPERSMLTGDDDYNRNPASDMYGGAGGRDSWISRENVEQNGRDQARGTIGDEQNRINSSNTQVLSPSVKRVYKSGNRATRADFVDDVQNDTSLWAGDGQSNFFFSKNKVREVGDILTITIENDLYKDLNTEVMRSLTPTERDYEMDQAQERAKAKEEAAEAKKDSVSSSAAATKKPDKKEETETASKAAAVDIDITNSVDLKNGDTFMAEVLERFPNGNYKIRGLKKVRYRNTVRYISMLGIVRGQDISDEATVNSGKLYEYRLETAKN